jgi:hypothetical protein
MAVAVLTPHRTSSLLINSTQIKRASARFTFDPNQKENELLKHTPAHNISSEDIERRMRFAFAENAPRVDLERLFDGNDMMNVNYLERGMIAARSVGRIAGAR